MAAVEEALGSLSLNQQDELARLSGAAFSPSELGLDFGMGREEAAGRLLNQFVANPVQVAPFVGGSLIPPESPITTLPSSVTDLNVPTPVQPVEETQPIWERALKRIADVFIPEAEGAEAERSALTDAARSHIASRESSERTPESKDWVPTIPEGGIDMGTFPSFTWMNQFRDMEGDLPLASAEALNKMKAIEELASGEPGDRLLTPFESSQWKSDLWRRDNYGSRIQDIADLGVGGALSVTAPLVQVLEGIDTDDTFRQGLTRAKETSLEGLGNLAGYFGAIPDTPVNAAIELMSSGTITPERLVSGIPEMQSQVDTFSEPTVEWTPPTASDRKKDRAIERAAEASRKAEAKRVADTEKRAAEQRAALDAASQKALQNHMAWMATQAAQRAEEERLRALRGYGSGGMWT